LTGQAGRIVAPVFRAVLVLAVMTAVLTAAGVAVLSWRLSRGPLESPWLARQFETTASAFAAPAQIAIGSAAIAWEGWRRGLDSPLDIRLSGVTATDSSGTSIADIPHAFVALSPGALLRARLRPRSIDVEGPRLSLSRAADGTIGLQGGGRTAETNLAPSAATKAGSGELPGFVSELARPAGTDQTDQRASFVAQLRRVHIRDGALTVVDGQLGTTWRVPRLDVELTRSPAGGVEGRGEAEIELGDERAALRMSAVSGVGGAQTHVEANLGPLQPAALARASPKLAPLAALEAPVSLAAEAELGPQLALRSAKLEAQAQAGRMRFGPNVVQLAGGAVTLEAKPGYLTLRKLSASMRARDGGAVTQLQAHGEAQRMGKEMHGALTLELDQAAFADLPVLWPEGAGGHAREWVTANIPSGTARNGHVEVEIAGSADLSSITLTRSSGTVMGDDITVYWLRPVPPIEHARAKLRILDPDTLEITAESGQQDTDATRAPLAIRNGKVKITGLEQHHQSAAIDADSAGGVADVVALLSQPRLRLLDKHPLPGRDPGGQASIRLHVQLPLQEDVKIEDVAIHAQAHLTGARLADIVAGRDLNQGTLDLDATNDGLKVEGDAQLAGIAAQLAVAMDFRAGPPTQVLQKVTASGQASAVQMAAAGVDPGPLLSGTADVSAVLTEQRNGKGLVQADADLANAELSAAPIGWRKPPGSPARLSARIVLDHDKLAGIEALSLEGKDVSVRGQADYAGGRIAALRFDRMALGRTQAQGVVRFPPPGDARPVQATFNGPVIDLSAISTHKRQSPAPKSDPGAAGSPHPWTLNARFDRALMAGGRTWLDLAGNAENDGKLFQRLSLTGQTSPGQPLRFDLAPRVGNRALTASAANAGALLAGLDLTSAMEGGRLTVSGAYDDQRADHALSGNADITDFRVRDPRGLGRLLQAMTLYGLVQAASGPGLGFTRLTAPFTLTDDALEFGQSRAFNPSLGLTAKGRIDLRSNVANIEGTIVPAYFFNSLLGHVPLIGKLFSPEQGGGLFAASYTIKGPMSDPKVSVNPLSALTPGFLRGVFDLF
jgi:hypothetical protein